jgi:hypothetical protein
MCCFSRPVEHVSSTQIFARPLVDGRQYLVYNMSFSAAGELAMILPLPVPPRPSEDAVRFLDLSGYDDFFDDLKKSFPVMFMQSLSRSGGMLAPASAAPILKVHDVGAFEASFVPTLGDFERLDERFRLSPSVWDTLPAYRDFGFAVFKLKPKDRGLMARLSGKSGPETVHPMAFVFPRRNVRSVFFPTVHIHDGEVHRTAVFDHTLYVQPDELTEATFAWEKSLPLGTFIDTERALGIVDGTRLCYRRLLFGTHPNADVDLTPPECAPSSLRRIGRCFELRLNARTAYVAHPADGRIARWRESARTGIDALSAGLADGIDALVKENENAWGLSPHDGPAVELRWNGSGVVATEHTLDPRGLFTPHIPASGPLRVLFSVASDCVEPQNVCLTFRDMPEPRLLAEIAARLASVLERVSV